VWSGITELYIVLLGVLTMLLTMLNVLLMILPVSKTPHVEEF